MEQPAKAAMRREAGATGVSSKQVQHGEACTEALGGLGTEGTQPDEAAGTGAHSTLARPPAIADEDVGGGVVTTGHLSSRGAVEVAKETPLPAPGSEHRAPQRATVPSEAGEASRQRTGNTLAVDRGEGEESRGAATEGKVMTEETCEERGKKGDVSIVKTRLA